MAESVLLLSRTALSDAVAGETRRFSTLTQLSSGAAPVPLALNASRATVAALAASGAAVSGSFSAASSVAYSSFTVPAANQRDLLAAAGASPADAVSRAAARPLVTVEPWVDGDALRIPPEAGYGPVTEPLSAL